MLNQRASYKTSLLLLTVVLLFIGAVVPQATTTSAAPGNTSNFSSIDYLIQSSYSLTSPATIDCGTLTAQECNHTVSCYYNYSVSGCFSRQSALVPGNISDPIAVPWCYNHFPTPFIASVYFLAAFCSGFAAVGIIYAALYWNKYSIVSDAGEVLYNARYKDTSFTVAYCILLLLASAVMAITSWINWNNPDFCFYVFPVYIFVIIVLLPVVFLPLMWLVEYIREKCSKKVEGKFVLDEHIKPTTAFTKESPYNCQMRCF